MNRRNTVGTVLVALAVVLFVVPAFFPVQPVLVHETWGSTMATGEQLEQEGFEVIAYENLSQRGQELYRKTLLNDGRYTVPQGEGAPEFTYLSAEEERTARENGNESAFRGVVIERPNESDLPPADEPRFGPLDEEEKEEMPEEERRARQAAQRYEELDTAVEQPPLGSMPQLIRLAAALLAVVFLGVGGYLLSSK